MFSQWEYAVTMGVIQLKQIIQQNGDNSVNNAQSSYVGCGEINWIEICWSPLPSSSPSDPYENKLKTLQVKYGAKPQPT